MTESDNGTILTGLPLLRACDSCRSRKIRCDKVNPCSNCTTANINCITSERPAKEQRQRVLISNTYEQKIDKLEDRLSGIEALLQQLVDNKTTSSDIISRVPGDDISRVSANVENEIEVLPNDGTDQDNHFEGESSLSAHSKQARRTLESLLGHNPKVRNDLEVAAALSALHAVTQSKDVSRHTFQWPVTDTKFGKGTNDNSMPSLSVVIDLIQHLKDTGNKTYLAWFMYFDMDELIDQCMRYYKAPGEASIALKVVVFGGLYYIFNGHPLIVEFPPEKRDPSGILYRTHAATCRCKLEECLLRFPMLLQPSIENITALATGAAHAMQVAEFPLCWSLTCAAARLCQTLGWHRGIAVDSCDSKSSEVKRGLFWTIYFSDKCLSLRLGISATFQDHDLAVDLRAAPDQSKDSPAQAWSRFLNLNIEIAALHGLVYEKLYSPGASRSTSEHRAAIVQDLATRIQGAVCENNEVKLSGQFEMPYMTMLLQSSEVILNCLLTLVYRKLPASNNDLQSFIVNPDCLEAARSAMLSHQKAIHTLEVSAKEQLLEYFSWTVLSCPFTPFMALFCNVVTTLDQGDLKLLEDFVISISGPAQGLSDAIIRFYKLCDGFYKLAKYYVAATVREWSNQQHASTSVTPRKRSSTSMLADGMQPVYTYGTSNHLPGSMTLDNRADWSLTGAFEEWFLGDAQSMDLFGGDWPVFGSL